ncbi:MAG: Undecaprenyl-phosphate 4-deoxy-4-formamido-L-arabinose transferase [Elusimicrobia bacterium]|nr:Undecaprenyl-phosphate 4-deoxy-4-formamido-L-arabinose transferase [Elusimicrobiota bacterium]
MTVLSVIIPAFNEANTIKDLLQQVVEVDLHPLGITKEIIVVESGSQDGTREIVQDFENRGVIRAHYEDRPRGKGHAVKLAFKNLTGDIVLIQDADLEYKPSEYPALLAPIQSGKADFVLGSRHLGKGDWHFRKFVNDQVSAKFMNIGNKVCNGLFNFLYGTHMTDPTTMFKVFRSSCISSKVFRSNYFELDWEIVAKLIRSGFIPHEVPISYVSRSFKEGKKIKLWRDGFLSLYAIVRFRWWD